jgi:uncharacterized membrane protein
MTRFSPLDDSCKGFNSEPSPRKGLHVGSSHVPSTLAVAAAVIFTLASAATNLFYGINKGIDLPSSIVWGSVAVAASIGLALAPSAFFLTLAGKRYTAAATALVAALVFGAYSVTAALGSASGGRMTAATEADEISQARARHQAAYDTAKGELEGLPNALPAAELQAEIAAIDALPGILIDGEPCGGTHNGRVTKEWCPKRAELIAEQARAERREALQKNLNEAAAMLDKLPKSKVVNTDAVALSGYLTAVGHPLSTDALNKLLVILAVLVIEFGGGLSLALAMGLRSDVSGHTTVTPAERVSDPAVAQKVSGTARKKRKRTRPDNKGGHGGPKSGGHRMPQNVVDLLKERGGRIEGGQRGIGRLLGLSKSRVNELLHELAAAGTVVLSTSKFGTTVQLATA